MSLHPVSHAHVPDDTAALFEALYPNGHPFIALREELGSIFTDAQFAHLYTSGGRPVESPATLALVLVLQHMDGLTDRQAADAVRTRIDWKYLLGLELPDRGFDFSLLSDFRQRLIDQQAEYLLFDHVLTAFKQRGLVKGGGQQRTDSTHVLAACRHLNRLELVGETLRQALNHLAIVAPDWLHGQVPTADWYDRYADRLDTYRFPRAQTARAALALTFGQDGQHLLEALDAPDTPAYLREVPAVVLLRQVWDQHYDRTGSQLRWRTAQELPPNAELLTSPYDPDARASRKRDYQWEGYQVHLTETCDDDHVHVITHVATVPATTQDVAQTGTIHAALAQADLLPAAHYVDAGYTSAAHLTASAAQDIALIGPVKVDGSWQAKAGAGFAARCFTLDWEAQVATCPQGHTSTHWSESDTQEHVRITFDRATCAACGEQAQCTRSQTTGRIIHVHPRAQHEALEGRRQAQQTPAFRERYQRRAGVEGTISQGVRSFGLRQCRYMGLAKTRLHHLLIAVAINLVRLLACLTSTVETPAAVRRPSAFAELGRV